MATIKNKKVECFESALIREIETSAFKLFMVANLQIRPCTTQNQMQFYCRTWQEPCDFSESQGFICYLLSASPFVIVLAWGSKKDSAATASSIVSKGGSWSLYVTLTALAASSACRWVSAVKINNFKFCSMNLEVFRY